MRCQHMREIVESDLIGSCGDDGVSATLGDDEVRERLHARHIGKLDLVVLALAEVFDGVVRPDGFAEKEATISEHEQIRAALSGASQLSIAPHVVNEGGAR